MDKRNDDNGEKVDASSLLHNLNIPVAIGSEEQHDPLHSSRTAAASASSTGHRKTIDWTRNEIPNASQFVRFLRGFEWSATALGKMETWSPPLRMHFLTMVANPEPCGLIWGEEEVFLYNEACTKLIGDQHPAAMGKHISTFQDFYNAASPAITRARERGESSAMTNLPVSVDRYENLSAEETLWTYNLIPVCGEHGTAEGVLCEMNETTSLVVAERRMATVLEMGRLTAGCEDLDDVWQGIIRSLEKNDADIPFAILYTVEHAQQKQDEAQEHERKGAHGTQGRKHDKKTVCNRVAVMGLEADDNTVPPRFSLEEEEGNGLADIFREIEETRNMKVVEAGQGMPDWMHKGINGRCGGFPCSRVVLMPIPPMSGAGLLGFLVMGLSTRRPYDEDYKLFLRLLSDRLLSSTAQVSLPKEQRESQVAAEEAALRHAALSRQLALKSQEAERGETRILKMAEQAPVGWLLVCEDMRVLAINDEYRKITKTPEGSKEPWTEMVEDEDKDKILGALKECRNDKKTTTFQYRLKRNWSSTDPKTGVEMYGPTWINAMVFPEIEEGEVTAMAGWITDISLQKWTEEAQARRLEEALELKRQRERFIDMTSHEMRNPLSAILQSADSIMTSIMEARKLSNGGITLSAPAVEAIAEAAETINLCSNHQKRIVDDILSVSKLDSKMMKLAPERVRPRGLLEKALKMYEGEIIKANIDAVISVDDSYNDLDIHEVILDPSRILQVLINLLTNSVKFTREEPTKKIRLCLSASRARPESDALHNITYLAPNARESSTLDSSARRNSTASVDEWGPGQTVYLQFAVEDTGRGLTPQELDLMFKRFSQASAKTHQTYGGSGLGLFISKELTELQGGQIGVSSGGGKTCFAFFVKALQVSPETRRPSVATSTTSEASAVNLGNNTPDASRPSYERSLSAVNPLSPTAQDRSSSPWQVPRNEKHGLHILLVEDNLINQKVISAQLRRAGNTVHVANHGLEALEFLQRTNFVAEHGSRPPPRSEEEEDTEPIPLSIILCDMEMPICDGATTIKRIREMEREGFLSSHVPTIAITANARSEQIDEAKSLGMDSVVTKPFRIPDLIKQMHELLRTLGVMDDAQE